MSHFTLELMPKFNETDALGHINNTVLPVWFEAAREPIFKIFNPAMDLNNWNLILAGFNIAYKAQTYFGKPVKIITQIIEIGNASFKVKHQCYQHDVLTAEALVSMVHFNYQASKSAPIPKNIRQLLTSHS